MNPKLVQFLNNKAALLIAQRQLEQQERAEKIRQLPDEELKKLIDPTLFI